MQCVLLFCIMHTSAFEPGPARLILGVIHRIAMIADLFLVGVRRVTVARVGHMKDTN